MQLERQWRSGRRIGDDILDTTVSEANTAATPPPRSADGVSEIAVTAKAVSHLSRLIPETCVVSTTTMFIAPAMLSTQSIRSSDPENPAMYWPPFCHTFRRALPLLLVFLRVQVPKGPENELRFVFVYASYLTTPQNLSQVLAPPPR